MSHLRNVLKKITASSGSIKTSEPIKIGWKIATNQMLITVDGIDYATINGVHSIDDVDQNKIKEWVEETYYDDDYKSDQYSPPSLKLTDFK